MRALLAIIGLTCAFGIFSTDALALTISPTKIDLAGDPGQTLIGEIELFNEQTEEKTFYTSFENFEPRGETGAPFFVGGGTGLASWLGAQGSVTLAPGERLFVPYSLTIPADATPGGYFAAIFFGTQPPADDAASEVSIGGKVGTLLLLRVNGEVAEEGGVLGFASTDSQRLFAALPITLEYRFSNDGGDRAVPKGEITISNTVGMTTAVLNANVTEGSVLPNSIRRFSTVWGTASDDMSFFGAVQHQISNFHLGLYTADLSITWGETSQKSQTSFSFFILPWQLLSVILIAGVGLFYALRAYNRFIISRAKQS